MDQVETKKDGNVSLSAGQWANVIHPATEARPHIHDATHKVPPTIEGTLASVAASMIYSAAGMSRWGLVEATLGLYKLHCRHVRDGAIDTINGSFVSSVVELQEIAHWIKWAQAAYHEKIQTCAKELEIQEDCIVELVKTSEFGKPAFLLALNHPKKAVVLSIRGTLAATDVLTDLKPHSERFGDGHAHSGMLSSARWFRDNVSSTLKDLMAKHGYRLVVAGHSLGAGTASLLSMLLRETNEKGLTVLGSRPELVTCWGICCPPCVDRILAEEATYVRCVIHQDDIVARISPAALEDLRAEILQTDWSEALDDGSTVKSMLNLANKSVALLDNIEPALNYKKGELMKQVKEQGLTSVKQLTNDIAMGWWTKATGGAYGAAAKQAASLLSSGVSAAAGPTSTTAKIVTETVNEAISKQMKAIEQNNNGIGTAVTANTIAANTEAATSKGGSSQLERNRLFVPGLLYHVIRRPLQPGEELPDDLPLGVGSSKGVEKGNNKFLHIVVRGDDPSSRFQRIVLSTTFISDHLCPGVQEAVADAMKWQQSGKRI